MDPFKPWQAKPRPLSVPDLTVESAQTIALQAVGFIAGHEELLGGFVALTGCGLDDLRARLQEPAFLGGILDFLLADEPSLLAFTEAAGLAAETPMVARRKLP